MSWHCLYIKKIYDLTQKKHQRSHKKSISNKFSTGRSKNFCTKIFNKLQKHQIIDELHARDLKFTCAATKKSLQTKLEQKVEDEGASNYFILWLTVTSYEILGKEPLHEINGHIKNLNGEIFEHVPNKTYLQYLMTTSYEGKEVKRNVDTRLALLLATSCIKKLYINYFHSLLRHCGDKHRLLSVKSVNAENEKEHSSFWKV